MQLLVDLPETRWLLSVLNCSSMYSALPQTKLELLEPSIANDVVNTGIDHNLVIIGCKRLPCHLPDDFDMRRSCHVEGRLWYISDGGHCDAV